MVIRFFLLCFRGSVLEKNTVVGAGSSIGESTRVSNSVVGSSCKIGNDVTIIDAYLWNNVTIKDGCSIEMCLLADDVILNESVELGRGCVIGPGVSLAAGTKVPTSTRLVAQGPKDVDEFDECQAEISTAPISPGSKAFVYRYSNLDDSDGESLVDDPWGLEHEEDEEDIEDEEVEGVEENSDEENDDVVEQGDRSSDSSPLPEEARCNNVIRYDLLDKSYLEK